METNRVRQWVYERLSTDTVAGGVHTLTGGRIYGAGYQPATVASPYVVLSEVSTSDRTVMGGTITHVLVTEQVDVFGTGVSDAVMETLANRIQVRIHQVSGATTGASIFFSRRAREIPFNPTTEADGKLWKRKTVEFLIEVQQT